MTLVSAVLVGLVGLVGASAANAQTKKRTARKATSTSSTTPDPNADDVRIVSTDDPDPDSTSNSSRPAARPRLINGGDNAPATISSLSRQVNALNQRIAKMETNQRGLVDLERLARAEQRADNLRTQLFAAQDREAELQARIDQITFDLQPENIESSGALNGSTRPEVVREQRRKWLETERAKAVAQLAQASANRLRLEGAVASADGLVDKLRRAVDSEGVDTENNAADVAAPPADNGGTDTGDAADREPTVEPANVPTDPELVRMIKSNLADANITSVTVEATNGTVILTGDIPSARVQAALHAARDAHPRRVYNQMTVR